MSIAGPALDRLKDSLRAMWTAGDFGALARRNASEAESFAQAIGIAPGIRVLDIACGTGNVAIPLARQGSIVTGVDIAPNLLAQARERAAAEKLSVTFDEGDAEALPYEEASFDAAVSMFGAMFAPRPEVVAAEIVRVLRPGGRLGMANWNPGSFSDKMFKVTARHVPSPLDVPTPVLWGDEAVVRDRLEPHFEDIQSKLVPLKFEFDTNPAGVVAFFRKNFGPTQTAFHRLDPGGQAALAADLEELWADANVAPDKANRTVIENQYLMVTATRTESGHS